MKLSKYWIEKLEKAFNEWLDIEFKNKRDQKCLKKKRLSTKK